MNNQGYRSTNGRTQYENSIAIIDNEVPSWVTKSEELLVNRSPISEKGDKFERNGIGSRESNVGVDLYDDNDEIYPGMISRVVKSIHTFLHEAIIKNKKVIKILALLTLVGLYIAYMGVAVAYTVRNDMSIDWCDGLGMLFILTGLLLWGLTYYFILKKYFGKSISKKIMKPIGRKLSPLFRLWYVKLILVVIILGGICVFLYFDTKDQPERLISAGGLVVLVFIGLIISKHPGHIQWSQVLWGIGIQFIMGLIVLRWRGGQCAFECISAKVSTFLDFTNVGSEFVYGYLSHGIASNSTTGIGDINIGPVFVFKNLSVIFFFSFFIQLLYHYEIMQWVVEKLGWILQLSIGTTAAESMNAAANIFVGQTEAPILIKPFLSKMTNSELHAVMTGGFATIAGSVMAAYISMGIEATYLLSASVMAAPAALAYSKLLYPETKKSQTTAKDIKFMDSIKQEGTALDAAAQGAMQGVALIGNIVANIIAFMAFIAFLDALVNWLGVMVGLDYLSFQWLLSQLFIPVAYLIGIDGPETEDVATLLGLKTVVNEFVAYQRLRTMTLSPRSEAIATYALCSFANVSSIGIQLGGLSVMAPERRNDLSKTIIRAFIAGSIAGLLNACIAGTLLSAAGYEEFRANGFDMPRNTGSSCF